MSKNSLLIHKIIIDPSIIVKDDEDLKIRNHIPKLLVKALNKTIHEFEGQDPKKRGTALKSTNLQLHQIASEKLKISERCVFRYKQKYLIAYDIKTLRFTSLLNFNGAISEIDNRFIAPPVIILKAKKILLKTQINSKNNV